MKITSYIKRDPETNMYVATVPFIPGAHTQSATLDSLYINLEEVVKLYHKGKTHLLLKTFLKDIDLTMDELQQII